MRVVIAAAYVPFLEDDGLRVVEDLERELAARGHRADTVKLPFAPANTAEQTLGLRLLDLSESSGDRIDRLIAVGAPICALRHPHKTAWLLNSPENRAPADAATISHNFYLHECKKVFAVSPSVAEEIKQVHGKEAPVLRPPPPGSRGVAWDHVIENLIA